ncbi:hypothetical protein E2320_013192 [Naja naja]|nr:hypothetical protein E2320_013192 [Naja naja]
MPLMPQAVHETPGSRKPPSCLEATGQSSVTLVRGWQSEWQAGKFPRPVELWAGPPLASCLLEREPKPSTRPWAPTRTSDGHALPPVSPLEQVPSPSFGSRQPRRESRPQLTCPSLARLGRGPDQADRVAGESPVPAGPPVRVRHAPVEVPHVAQRLPAGSPPAPTGEPGSWGRLAQEPLHQRQERGPGGGGGGGSL